MDKGQGALEYLLLIGGAVVAVLIVIFLLLNISGEFRDSIEVTAGTDFSNNGENGNGDGNVSISGLIGHWSFENGSLDDSSSLENDGNSVGGIVCAGIGKVGDGCTFSDKGGWVNISKVNDNDDPVKGTITAWVKSTSNKSERYIISGKLNNVTYIRWDVSNFRVCKGSPVECTVLIGVSQGVWYHIAMTWEDSNIMKVYLNGDLKEEKNFDWGADDGDFQLGGKEFAGEEFIGIIDEVMFFNRALSEKEILALSRALSKEEIQSLVQP